MKYPYIPLYTGDWIKDPALSLCAPSTRGIWIDFLCAMHELGSQGVLTGTATQLSRVGRCSDGEVVHALGELSTFRAADVSERQGTFTVVNRRMKRDYELARVRAASGGKAIAKRQQNAEGDIEAEIESCDWWKDPEFEKAWQDWSTHRDSIKKPIGVIAKLQQIKWIKSMGRDRAMDAIYHSIRNNWQGIFEERGNGKVAPVKQATSAIPLWRQIQIITEEIAVHPANQQFSGYNHATCTDAMRDAYRQKRTKLAELKARESASIT